MAEYKLTTEIVPIVSGLLDSIDVPKYPHTRKPVKVPDEYIVINSLPINAEVMQFCYFNVNYYCKDIDGGKGVGNVPDTLKLDAGAKLVLAILKKVSSDNYLIDFESQEVIPEETEHYINLRFSFKYINNS